MSRPEISFFTRVLDEAAPAVRYQLAIEQIQRAEQLGFDSAWVAQHHFHGSEGGLPSPLVFLANVAAHTSTIRLGTGVITLNLEDPIRVAEDAAVLDALTGGRLELGFSAGGTPSSFPPFGVDFDQRYADFERKYAVLVEALSGGVLGANSRSAAELQLYPPAPGLLERIWFATFSEPLARRAGQLGHGLLLSRTQPKSGDSPDEPVWVIQNRIIDGYLSELEPGIEPRISVARTVFVADSAEEAREYAEIGYRKLADYIPALTGAGPEASLDELLARTDAYIGTPEQVTEQLNRDRAVARATQLSFQVHSIDPPHDLTLRSAELLAKEVIPYLELEDAREVVS